MSAPSDSPRALIRYTLVGLALTVGICWALWEVGDALVLVYISALMAIGLSPLVNAIERKRLMRQQVPRWAAILVIYLCIIGAIIGVGILVIPAIVTAGARSCDGAAAAAPPGPAVVDRSRPAHARVSAQEAVQQTATSSGAQDTHRPHRGAVWGFVGGVFGVITILVLAFYLLVEAAGSSRFSSACSHATSARSVEERVPAGDEQGQRLARRAAAARAGSSAARRRSACS